MNEQKTDPKPWPELQKLLPPHSKSELKSLEASIREYGVLENGVTWTDLDKIDWILDGTNRKTLSDGNMAWADSGIPPDDTERALALGVALNVARRNLSNEQIEELQEGLGKRKELKKKAALEIRKQGKTQKETAALVGVDQSTIGRWENGDVSNMQMHNACIPETPDLRLSVPKSEYEKIYTRHLKGETQVSIAADYKVSRQTISNIISKEKSRIAALDSTKEQIESELKSLKGTTLEKYIDAIKKGEISLHEGKLYIEMLETEFIGQEKHFPKYSGQEEDYLVDYENVPLFTEKEWEELNKYEQEKDEIWEKEFQDFQKPYENICIFETGIMRQTYDPEYGDFITKDEGGYPLFIKKEWGEWRVLIFNDGEGGRNERIYFQQDWLGDTYIEEATKTIHPHWISDTNRRNLEVYNIQKYEASWGYFRMNPIRTEDMIKALKKDLEEIENTKPLSDEEIKEKVIEFLKEQHESIYLQFIENPQAFREGVVTTKRLPDGSIDKEFYDLNGVKLTYMLA